MRDNPSQKQLWPLYFPTWFLGSTILIPHLRGDLDNLIDDLYNSSNRWFPFEKFPKRYSFHSRPLQAPQASRVASEASEFLLKEVGPAVKDALPALGGHIDPDRTHLGGSGSGRLGADGRTRRPGAF